MRKSVCAVPALAGLLVPSLLFAQASPAATQAAQPPYIATSAVGESRITPDRAVIQVAVSAENESAKAAGAELQAKQERVVDAVRAAGVPAAQIRTMYYNVNPQYRQEKGGKMKLNGYVATNMVQLEVRNLENVGKIIDAALVAGATSIGSVRLFAANTDSARREAVTQAVAKARGEAEAAAVAAGGTLGTIIELLIDPVAGPRPNFDYVVTTGAAMSLGADGSRALSPVASSAAMARPIEPGETIVSATVRVRWQFAAR